MKYSRGPNNNCVTIGNKDVYFSYETIIAFRADGRLYVHANDWSNTTGRHLNDIDGGDKAGRLKSADFRQKLKEFNL